MLLLSVLMIISVNSYEDCHYVEKTYTLKRNHYDFTKKEWIDDDPYTNDVNFTFIAENADSCKSRAIRKYVYKGDYFDSKINDNYVETFYEHCCFFSYDDMEKYEYNVLEEEQDKIKDLDEYYNRGKKEVKKEEIKGSCKTLSENQYKNIKEYIIYLKNTNGHYKNLKIDCYTSYLQFFMISLLLLFLL